MDSRKRMGKDKGGVIFPVAPNLSEMSDSYLDFIEEVKKEIQKQRISVVLNANSSMICLYWNIVGQRIEGDANDKLFFRPLKNRPRSLGANGRLTAIIRHIIGEY